MAIGGSAVLHAAALDHQLDGLLTDVGQVVFYLIVWGLVFVGTGLFVGAFIPFITGDSLLFGSGLVAAAASGVNIWVLAIGTGLAALAGDQLGFALGLRYGRPYLDRHGGRRTRKAIERTENFYRTFGWWSVVIARFMPWARVFVPVIAGIGRMGYMRFTTSNALGALAWGVGITATGYAAAMIPGAKAASYLIAGCCITASVIAGIRAWHLERKRGAIAATPGDVSTEGQ